MQGNGFDSPNSDEFPPFDPEQYAGSEFDEPGEHPEEDYYGEPPYRGDQYSQSYNSEPGSRFGGRKRKKSTIGYKVVDILRSTLAAQHKQDVNEVLEFVQQIKSAERVLEQLDDDFKRIYVSIFEIFIHESSLLTTGAAFDIFDLSIAYLYAESVKDEVSQIREIVRQEAQSTNPASDWFAIVESVQRFHASRSASKYIMALKEKENTETLLDLYGSLDPPTSKKALTRERRVMTARELSQKAKADLAATPPVRFSSGYRTLDFALTAEEGSPLGFIGAGEQVVVAGPTGTGKSSFSYGLVSGITQDMINWGYPDSKVLFFHTEEESSVKIRAAELTEGERYYHLSDNVVVDFIGTSRQRMVEVVYDTVIEAYERSQKTGQPIDRYLPRVVILDYIQALTDQRESEVEATKTTSELLLRGFQAWDPAEMAKFSGVNFQTYAGMRWPEGMENHRVSVIAFAQLVKQDDDLLNYKPGERNMSLTDFTEEDETDNPGWVDPEGNHWAWEVREGDFRLFKQNAIRGSGVVLQNATTIILLHRSRPRNNPALPHKSDDGRFHLMDTRARLVIDKARTGQKMKTVPMSFDLDRHAFRARYYDVYAEIGMSQGLFVPDVSYQDEGDPILPPRPSISPFSGIRY